MAEKELKIWQHWRRTTRQSNYKQIPPLRFSTILDTAVLSCLILFLPVSASMADADAPAVKPLSSSNQSPLIRIYGLPALGESRVLGPGESTLSVQFQVANHFTGSDIDSESLSLDGETHRLSLIWRQGLPGDREWGVELPYLSHNRGFLDMSVEEFHDLFGLSQNGRTDVPRNRIEFRYSRDGITKLNLTRSVSGPGDVRLFAGKKIAMDADSGGYSATWRASLKLPTGDDAKLLGSGSTDLAAWLSVATMRPPDKWNLYGGGGLLIMSKGDVLPEQQRQLVGFATVGISQKFIPALAVNAQLDLHTPFYSHSRLKQLGKYTAVGLLGVIWEFEPKKFLEFSISEDLVVGASPDVAFNLSVSVPF